MWAISETETGGGGQQETIKSGQIITTSAEVTLNGGLIRELPQNPLNSGLGIILICPDQMQILAGLKIFFPKNPKTPQSSG